MSLSGIPVFSGANRPAATHMLRRTRRWSWMVSGWFEPVTLGADGGGTACMTVGCSDDFVAVRLGFPNVSREPFRITRAIGRPSSTFNDYVAPTGDANWTPFTMRNGGRDTDGIVAGFDSPVEIQVRGLDDTSLHRESGVRWTWTDWSPMRSLPADPATGMRVLMLRALVPAMQTVTFSNGQLRGFTGNRAINRGHDLMIGGLKFNIDAVSRTDGDPSVSTQTWIDNQLGPGTLFPMVQFLTNRPGISGIVAGDSHAQGSATTEQFSSFLYGATTSLGLEYLNQVPFSMANCAVGGLPSAQFFARWQTLIEAVRPSYAVLQGWTYNDANGDIRADRAAMDIFLARLLGAAETATANGILPLILTPFPRDGHSMTPVQLGPWRQLRETLLALRGAGAVVIDATSILGNQENGIFDGTYRPGLSADQMHPNDEGHMAVASAITQAIKRYI